MNKTISINLGGSVFNIEEDAFHILRSYLEAIQSNFAGDPASAEIMSDIEARIAELFNERNNEIKNVVVRADVDEIIAIMGKPEDYKMDDDHSSAGQSKMESGPANTRNNKRKIYRDTDDAIVGGVCSGLSHYFGCDPIVIRLVIVFICFVSFGTGIFGYILFWALVPAATTTAEKLHMRGEPVNVENIGRFINEESKSAGERINRFGRNAGQQIRSTSGDLFNAIIRIVSVVFGLFIMFMGFGLLAGLFSLAAFSEFNVFGFDSTNWTTFNSLIFGNDGTMWVLAIGIVLAMGAPAIALIYAGIKLITRTNRRIRGLGLSLLSLFIIGAIMCIYGGIKTGKQFSRDAEVTNTTVLSDVTGDTLYMDVMPDDIFIGRNAHHNEFHDLVKIGTDSIYYGQPVNVRFEPAASGTYRMEIERRSNGRNMEQAGTLARNIQYVHEVKGDSIYFGPYFTTPRTDHYRGQSVDITLFIPVGKYVHFGKNAKLITWHRNEEVLRMSDDGLVEQDEMDEHELNIESPSVKVTEDSVIIKTGGVEIKSKRD